MPSLIPHKNLQNHCFGVCFHIICFMCVLPNKKVDYLLASLTFSAPASKPPSEYMVKHSSDGMKITINKTKSKDKSSSGLTKSASFNSGSNSPKIHTGLKPGVNSGPASKKPSIGSSSGSSSKSSGVSGIPKLPFQKSSSSGNLSSGTGSSGKVYSPSKSSSGGIKEKSSKSSKSSSNSTLSASTDKYRTDATDIMKMLGFSTTGQGNDSFMKSTKFQIPKISARTSTSGGSNSSSSGLEDYRKEKSTSHSAPNTPSTNTNTTSLDFSSKLLTDFNKYPMSYSAASKLPGDISPMHVPSAAAASLNKISVASSPKYNTQADTREAMNLETYHSQKLNAMGLSFAGSLHSSSESFQEKVMESMKQQQQQRSTTPSHSVHATVVKSPSPLIIIPSPRSNEHMADDDNLMEELVAITK